MATPISRSPNAARTHPAPLIAGTGPMAAAYVEALRALGASPARVVGRDPGRAGVFAAAHGVLATGGGAERLSTKDVGPIAIVAASHAALASVAWSLLEKGCRTILLEKPGALRREDLAALAKHATAAGAQVFVAYNRRFYPTVTRLAAEIKADGGLLSCQFDFTEVERLVIHDGFPDEVLHRWGLVNSTHVIDLAFFLAGPPREIECRIAGGLPWHPAGAIFVGSGVSERGALLSWHADWASAGRWKLNLHTARRRFLLEPLESLQAQERGSFAVEPVALAPCPETDAGVKPGLYHQVDALLRAHDGDVDPRLCTLAQHLDRWPVYERILGYDRGRQTKNTESAIPASTSACS